MAERKYWLFKSEPTAYSFDALMSEENQTAEWDGVRNYQVRNFMRDEMRQGDAVLFYHSSTTPTAVVGTATIVSQAAYPDVTAWDPQDKHSDPKSSPDNPAWLVVDIKADREFARPVTLAEIKQNPALAGMLLVRRGMRLSVQPVTQAEYEEIVHLGTQNG